MSGLDQATWQALTLLLTGSGLVVSVLVWRTRGAASGLRGVAWSLLPVAAYLTGTLRLVWQVADAVVAWATRLVVSPAVWSGLVVAGFCVLLFFISGILRRRTPRTGGRSRRAGTSGQAAAGATAARSRKSRVPAAPVGEDTADIEAILRRHGIT